MATYRVTLADGQKFLMSADLSQASAPLSACFNADENDLHWQGTPYQTADARHREFRAAELLAEYFRDGPDDCTEIEEVESVED